METRGDRTLILTTVIMLFLCNFSGNAQKVMTLPFDYTNWKLQENSFSCPELLDLLPAWYNSQHPLKTIQIVCLFKDDKEHFSLNHIWDITYGEGLGLGYLIVYKQNSSLIYDYYAPFATYEYDLGMPVAIIYAAYHDMVKNGISKSSIIQSIKQLVYHRLALNKWGPGDGYYESPEYSSLILSEDEIRTKSEGNLVILETTPLLEEFKLEYPFLIGLSLPESIKMLCEFAKGNGYCPESRQDVKEMLITLYLLLSSNGNILR